MPLSYADESIDPLTLQKIPQRFIVFYASVVDGEMWCPDCRRVEDIVLTSFSDTGPDALVVYVGTKPVWRSLANVYRQEPWKISNIPTIIKLKDGTEVARLKDDQEILKDLKKFVEPET